MTESISPQRGRVVWHDLMTTDVARAKEFYGQLFGWELKSVDMGSDCKYDMIHAAGSDIGGMVPLDTGEGQTSHWIAYAAVDSLDEAVRLADANGGKTHVPPTEIPGIGRFAIISGPEGGTISPFESAHAEAAPEQAWPVPQGHFCWEELLTRDPGASRDFYPKIFGWETRDMDMGPMGTYTTLNRGDVGVGGMMRMPDDVPAPSHWLGYVHVEDVDATASRVTELGGQLIKQPDDIPNVGRFAICVDPTGAPFALYRSLPQGSQECQE